MGPLGKGSWHEWQQQHLVALLGSIWYNTSKSDSSCISWKRFQRLVFGVKGVWWKSKFIRPAETRWMVVWEGAEVLEDRWEEVRWLHSEWAAQQLLGTPFMDYWFKALCMLDNPLIRVHAKFCVALRKVVLGWAYNWIRGKGGYLLKGTTGGAERLPPGMRLAEAADFSLLLLRRIEELRARPWKYFPELLWFALNELTENEFLHFLRNFENAEGGFVWEMSERWTKWVDMHQHLPYSMARLACSSFYEGKWAGADKAYEHAVGQEFARALLVALWPEQYESAEWREWDEEHDFLGILEGDLSEATTTREKDELTFGMYTKLNESAEFRKEVEEYAASAHGKKEV
ncbi:unnamed protein product, partial [Ectocarpus sp. 8 AP-2014]